MKLHLPKLLFTAVMAASAMAFAGSFTPEGSTEAVLEGTLGYYSNGSTFPTVSGTWDGSAFYDGRFHVQNDTSLTANAGTLIFASGKTVSTGGTKNSGGAQLWIAANDSTAGITCANNLILGTCTRAEGNAFGNAAVRMGSEQNKAALITGNITLVADAKIGVQGNFNTISGNIAGAGHSLTIASYNGGGLTVTSEAVTLVGINHTDTNGTVNFGTATTVANLSGSIVNSTGTMNLNGTYTFDFTKDITKYAQKTTHFSKGTYGFESLQSGDTVYAIKGATLGADFHVTETAGLAREEGTDNYVYTYSGETIQLDEHTFKVNGGNATIDATDAAQATSVNVAANSTITLDGVTTLNSGSFVLNNKTITLKLTNGTQFEGAKVSNGTGFLKNATVSVDGTSKLTLTNDDALGWDNGNRVAKLILEGTDSTHMAHVQFNNTQTMATAIEFKGNSKITGSAFNIFNPTNATTVTPFTVSGTNNLIEAELRLRRNLSIDIANAADTLEIKGKLGLNGNNNGNDTTMTKTGAGLLTISGDIDTRGIIDGGNTTLITSGSIQHNSEGGSTLTIKNVTFGAGMRTVQNEIILGGTINVMTTATGTVQPLAEGNGMGSIAYSNLSFLTGSGSATTADVTQWQVNGKDATATYANGALTTATVTSSTYYINSTADAIDMTGADAVVIAADGATYGNSLTGYNSSTALTIASGTTTLNADSSHQFGGDITVKAGAKLIGATTDGLVISNSTEKSITLENGAELSMGTNRYTMRGYTINLEGGKITGEGQSSNGALDFDKNATIKATGSNASLISANMRLRANLTFNVAEGSEMEMSGLLNSHGADRSIIKDGEGTLTLSHANTYNGTTTVNAGTVVMKDAAALSTGQVTVKNGATLEVASGVDFAAGSRVTLNNGASLTIGGSMSLNPAAPGAETSLKNLTMKDGATLTLGTEEEHANTVTVNTLTVKGASTLNADLVVAENGTINSSDVLTMGCSVTLNAGETLVITKDGFDADNGLYEIFSDVESLTLGSATAVESVWYDASDVFSSISINGEAVTSSDFLVGLWDNRVLLTNVNSAHAPEPATATLSLLALAGLCARRRRK